MHPPKKIARDPPPIRCISRLNTRQSDCSTPSQFRSRRQILFRRHARGQNIMRAGRKCRRAPWLSRDRARAPYTVDAVVVLPEHLYAIPTLPEGDADFPARWRRIKGLFTRAIVRAGHDIGRNASGDYALWQRRFWEHSLRDEPDFARRIDYILFNPVKHGLVSRVSDWPYSSLHRHVRQGWLIEDGAAASYPPESRTAGHSKYPEMLSRGRGSVEGISRPPCLPGAGRRFSGGRRRRPRAKSNAPTLWGRNRLRISLALHPGDACTIAETRVALTPAFADEGRHPLCRRTA